MKKSFFLSFILIIAWSLSFSQVKVTFRDDFDNNNSGWSTRETKDYKTSIADGKYTIAHFRESGTYSFWRSTYIDPNKDFLIEAKIRQKSGIDNYGFGLIWGAKNADNANMFQISSNGYARVYKYENEEYKEIEKWKKTSQVNKMGIDNILVVSKQGDKMVFMLNGMEVFRTGNMKFFGGLCGFIVTARMTIEIDYLMVKQDGVEMNIVENAISGNKKENLGPNVNSEYDELSPVISPDGKTLFLCRKNHPDNIGADKRDDIWFSELQSDGTWGKVANIGHPLNNDGNNSVISVSPDGNTLLIKNTYNSDGSAKGGGFSITHRLPGGGWEVPQNVEIKNYYNNNKYSNICMSADKNVMILAIERKDSYGDQDLYVSFKDGDVYTEPVNMGPVINTFEADFAPFLASDNRTLYYATSGKYGYGDADIYMTKRLDDSWTNWSEPKNLGPEINTEDWDAYYTISASGEYAYMVSSLNSIGKGDIFKIKQPEAAKPDPVCLVYGKVLNAKTKEPLAADIAYSDLSNDKSLGTASSNPDNGTYKIVLPYGKSYSFLANRKGFYAISENIDLTKITKYEEVERDLYLSPIEVGEVIRLNNIFFDVNKSELKPESFPELDRLVKILNDYQAMTIEIGGHTDSDGTDAYNLTLSQNRVKSVVDYVISKGIAADRLKGIGYGESKPIAGNDTDEGKAKNRRVEFKIIKM